MEKTNRLLLVFSVLIILLMAGFYIGFDKVSGPIGIIFRSIFLISAVAAGVTLILFLAESIGKKMQPDVKRRMLISKPLQWIIGALLAFIFVWLLIAIIQ